MPTKHKAKVVSEVLKLVNCCNLEQIKKLHQVINTIISVYLLHQRKTNRFSKKRLYSYLAARVETGFCTHEVIPLSRENLHGKITQKNAKGSKGSRINLHSIFNSWCWIKKASELAETRRQGNVIQDVEKKKDKKEKVTHQCSYNTNFPPTQSHLTKRMSLSL